MTIFSTRFGKSGYLKEALLEAILISMVGMVSSVTIPFIIPFTLKSPVVSTLSKSLEYVSGTKARKSLKVEPGFSNVISTS